MAISFDMTVQFLTLQRRVRIVAAAAIAIMSLAACEPAPAADPCVQSDPGKRALAGAYVRQNTGTPKLELIPITGSLRRNGRLHKIFIGDDDFDARRDRDSEIDGALKGFRGARAVPVEAMRDAAEGVFVYDFNYHPLRQPMFDGLAVLGTPTAPSSIPDSGNSVLRGRAFLRIISLAEGAESKVQELTGKAELRVSHGSKIANLTIDQFDTDAPFESITWRRVKLCGARLASSGGGGFQLLDDQGEPVLFAGASDASPAGTAIFDGRFYGADSGGKSTSIGGGILIQGDLGLISAVFVVSPGG